VREPTAEAGLVLASQSPGSGGKPRAPLLGITDGYRYRPNTRLKLHVVSELQRLGFRVSAQNVEFVYKLNGKRRSHFDFKITYFTIYQWLTNLFLRPFQAGPLHATFRETKCVRDLTVPARLQGITL
jgi:hypothetical protein